MYGGNVILLVSCLAVDCGRLPAPANGRIVITTTLFGGAAKYFCNSGFELTGSQIRRCSANGQWSNSAPTCRCECDQIHMHTCDCMCLIVS